MPALWEQYAITGGMESPGSAIMYTSGIALESDSVTYGASGVKKIWTEDLLRDGAKSLQGKPVLKRPDGDKIDDQVGYVNYASYKAGGIYYEAEIFNEDAAVVLRTGNFSLAPKMRHETVPPDPDIPYVVEDIEFILLFPTPFPCEGVPRCDGTTMFRERST